MNNPTLPPDTYGVQCEFHPGSQRYTYLVDTAQGSIAVGDEVVVATPKGGYKVISVVNRVAESLTPVDLKYMKYIVQKVDHTLYDELMKNLTEGLEAARPASPLIDDEDVDETVSGNAP